MARASVSGSRDPAAPASHRSAAATAAAPCAPATDSAAQQSAVVLMLLKLSTVSPQPPSAFWWAMSHAIPCATNVEFSEDPVSRSKIDRANSAVAVERALLESSPSQWPSAVRDSSRRRVALAIVSSSVGEVSARGVSIARGQRLKAQVPQREQGVVGVLAIRDVFGPVAIEGALARPQTVYEIDARLFHAGKVGVHSRQRVQRRRG